MCSINVELVCLMLSDVLTVDRAVENIGFGWFQIKLSLFTGLVWVCSAFFHSVVVVINVRNDVCHVVIVNTLTGI